jgi:hypothetical protein
VADAAETAEKNLRGLVPGKRVGDQLTLVFRPQEAVAAVAALDQAYRDYYAAVADHNRAQFQLYRALGHPAECLANTSTAPAVLPATNVPAPVHAGPAVPEPAAPKPATSAGPAVMPVATPTAPGRAQGYLRSPAPVSVHPTATTGTLVPPSINPN